MFSRHVRPTRQPTKDHELVDIFVIALCAFLGGGQTFNDMEEFGKANLEWFKRFWRCPTESLLTIRFVFSRPWSQRRPQPKAPSNVHHEAHEEHEGQNGCQYLRVLQPSSRLIFSLATLRLDTVLGYQGRSRWLAN